MIKSTTDPTRTQSTQPAAQPPRPKQGLKKGDKGLCLIAGDIYPIDVISHLPVLCEEKDTAYIYVPSKHDLGALRGLFSDRLHDCLAHHPSPPFWYTTQARRRR